jgi:hypothetical protein
MACNLSTGVQSLTSASSSRYPRVRPLLFYAETQAKFDLIAVGVGFVIMGVIGYIVKLGSSVASHLGAH